MSILARMALALGMAAITCAPLPALCGQPGVRKAQQYLVALGYRLGTPDGVAGSRTLSAISEVMEKYGRAFDGTVSDNELALLARIAPMTLNVDFGVAVSEIYTLDAADINGDGQLDFVLSAMADPQAQLGIRCCEVTAKQAKRIVPPIPQLVYSTPDGYAVLPFPPEAKGNRTFSGKFFASPKGTYFILGKNGEMGVAGENEGEFSMVLSVGTTTIPTLTTIAESELRGVTANVEVADLDGDGWPEIFINNYGIVGVSNGFSFIRTFGDDEVLRATKLTAPLEKKKAHNFIRLEDVNGDGKLDLLAAGEVWKSDSGKELISSVPGSYVVLDPFDRQTRPEDRLYLNPPRFGNDHVGFDLLPVTIDGHEYVLEASQKWTRNGFVEDGLDAFEFDPSTKSFVVKTDDIFPKPAKSREDAGGFRIRKVDLDFDGVAEIYREKYPFKPQYFHWNGTGYELRDFPAASYFKPEYLGDQMYLPDAELKCTRLVTSPQSLGGRKPKLAVQLSRCIPAGELAR